MPDTAGRTHELSDPSLSHPGELVNTAGLGPDRESPGRAGQNHGPSHPGCSHPGQLVDPAGPHAPARARVNRDRWSTPRALGHGPVSPGTAGRPCGPWDTCPSSPGQLGNAEGPQTQARVTRYSWSSPRDLGHQLEVSRPGQLVDSACPRTRDRIALDSWSTPRALAPWPESPRTDCGTSGPSNPSPSHPGEVVDTAGPRTRS